VLNSRGCAYFATIFDVLGTVTYTVNRKGFVQARLEVENISRAVAERFRAAYGGKITASGWRAERADAERFAKEAVYFAVDKKEQLELFSRGMRLVGAKKAIRTRDGFRQLPLSERDKIKRNGVAMELNRARVRLAPPPIPPKFLRSDASEMRSESV
jgi:hypothetical protein